MTEKLFLNDSYINAFEASVKAVVENGIVLDATAFYATSGGQPGDTGWINGAIVTDTLKSKEVPGDIIHVMSVEDVAKFTVGQKVQAELDWQRRYNHMRMHTALHLMCVLIKGYATGNQIGHDKSRIDFDVEMTDLDKDDLTKRLNDLISANYPVSFASVDESELDTNPSLVRTLSVQPPRGTGTIRMVTIGEVNTPVDRQPCGGTHVRTTSEIGPVTIQKIENKGKQNKRITLALDTLAATLAA